MTAPGPPREPADRPSVQSAQPEGRRSIKMVATILMSGALAGKALGFVREVIMAQIIGVALIADGFRTAITAILLPLAFLQNESVPAILIPMMKESQRHGDAPRRLASLSAALVFIGVLLMLLMLAAGELLVDAMVAGFTPEGQKMTLHFVRIMALSMPASVLINCLAAGEIALGKTRMTNLRASILNIGVIVGLGLLVVTRNPSVLAWAFTLAFNLLAAWGCWRLMREGNLSFAGLTARTAAREGLEFLRRVRPFLALPAAEQANIWLERLLASRLVTGAVASLDYARTLTDSTLLLISQPIGLALLAENRVLDDRQQAEAIARPVLAVAVPASVFLYMFATDIVRLVFHRGAFDEHGVVLTSQALSGIALGLWASTLGWILLRLLNNRRRNAAAAFILISAYAVNFGMNLLTENLQRASGMGVFFIGTGEAARSLVLLFGVVAALGCGAMLMRLIALCVPAAALMLLLGWQIGQVLPPSFERLMLGGVAYGACALLSARLLCPALLGAVFIRVRNLVFRRTPS